MQGKRTYFVKLGVVLVVALQLSLFVSCQDCLTAGGGQVLFDDDDSFPVLPNGTQAIITSYMFSCCANITSWQTFVNRGGSSRNNAYDIYFQVWRPSRTMQENGCYSLVDENRFTSIQLRGGNTLISRTLEPTNILTVRPGDVMGYFTISRADEDGGIQLNDEDNNENVLYDTITENSGRLYCPLSVGMDSSRTLRSTTNAAPAFLVDVSTFSCPPFPTISPSSSSSPPPSSTTSVPIQLSDTTPQVSPSPTSFPSGSSEPTVVPTTQSSGSTSDMLQQTTTPTIVVPTVSNDSLGGTIAAAVLVVIALVASVLVVLVVVLLLWRRKQKSIDLDATGKNIDLANPNYDYSVLLQNVSLSSKNQQNSSANLPYETPLVAHGGPNTAPDLYETIDVESPMDYINPQATIRIGSSTVSYPHTPDIPGKGEAGRSAETTFSSGEDALYHAVGPPDVTRTTVAGTRSGSTPPPPYPLLTPTKDSIGFDGIYNLIEDATQDPSVHYEDPTLPKFSKQDPVNQKGALELPGYYVPTEEERKTLGREQQSESSRETSNELNFFMDDPIYWAPATTASGLYGQLASKRYREIQRDQIRFLEKLGSGQFGEVCKALWSVDEQEHELAVKTLKPGASEAEKVKFLQEAAIMGQFSDSNIVKMHGVVTLGEPVLICLEILSNGDLRSYLRGLTLSGSKHGDFMEAQIMFLKFAKDIAAGMEYLSKKSFIHRDLAARNILLDKSLTCKIADFGMARDLMDDTYYTCSGGKIPVRWTAPEALLYKKYSADSDVWSYGMVLFEIWSMGKKPFSKVTNSEVLQLIQNGFCQAPPPGCPRAVYELMVDCWNPERKSRPTFSKICSSYRQQSSAKILYWDPEDETVSPTVGVCGAPLEEAHKLYPDLQDKYKDYDDII